MIRPPNRTPLQEMQTAFRDLVDDARTMLDERAYIVWVNYLVELVAAEAARCVRWEDKQR